MDLIAAKWEITGSVAFREEICILAFIHFLAKPRYLSLAHYSLIKKFSARGLGIRDQQE